MGQILGLSYFPFLIGPSVLWIQGNRTNPALHAGAGARHTGSSQGVPGPEQLASAGESCACAERRHSKEACVRQACSFHLVALG